MADDEVILIDYLLLSIGYVETVLPDIAFMIYSYNPEPCIVYTNAAGFMVYAL